MRRRARDHPLMSSSGPPCSRRASEGPKRQSASRTSSRLLRCDLVQLIQPGVGALLEPPPTCSRYTRRRRQLVDRELRAAALLAEGTVHDHLSAPGSRRLSYTIFCWTISSTARRRAFSALPSGPVIANRKAHPLKSQRLRKRHGPPHRPEPLADVLRLGKASNRIRGGCSMKR